MSYDVRVLVNGNTYTVVGESVSFSVYVFEPSQKHVLCLRHAEGDYPAISYRDADVVVDAFTPGTHSEQTKWVYQSKSSFDEVRIYPSDFTWEFIGEEVVVDDQLERVYS